jgi:glutaredoxin
MNAVTTYTVFVQPGCSSCLRAKEFLARNGVSFETVDVMNDPDGMQRLRALGVRNIPVVSLGKDFVFGQDIRDVARFVGVSEYLAPMLAPQILVRKWLSVLDIAQAYMGLIPRQRLARPPIPTRDGTVLQLGYHVFRIVDAFIDVQEKQVADWVANSMQAPASSITSGNDVIAYGNLVKERLRKWFGEIADRGCGGTVRTFQGEQSLHWFLERSAWHSAQHTRQLAAVLEEEDIAAEPELTSDLLAGLPVPNRIWV